MQSTPSIHDAYGGFGQKSNSKINLTSSNNNNNATSESIINLDNKNKQVNPQFNSGKPLPTDASHSNFPAQIKCPKCNNVCMTRMQAQLGTAAWLWCVLLAPFGCIGLSCLCIHSCKDKIHYCTRCGHIVGKKFAKAC